jgi:hypothetical protein
MYWIIGEYARYQAESIISGVICAIADNQGGCGLSQMKLASSHVYRSALAYPYRYSYP